MLKETQQIEFKLNFNEDVIETLVAFANAKGGKVLVGVDLEIRLKTSPLVRKAFKIG